MRKPQPEKPTIQPSDDRHKERAEDQQPTITPETTAPMQPKPIAANDDAMGAGASAS